MLDNESYNIGKFGLGADDFAQRLVLLDQLIWACEKGAGFRLLAGAVGCRRPATLAYRSANGRRSRRFLSWLVATRADRDLILPRSD